MAPLIGEGTGHVQTMLGALIAGLDRLKTGVAITDSCGQLLLANRMANKVLSEHDGLEVSRDGILELSAEHCPLPVRAMLGEIASSATANEMVSCIYRPSGRRPLTVTLRPVSVMGLTRSNGPGAIVFILDPERPATIPNFELQRRYSLTTAECNLASCLVEGMSLNACCARLGIRRATARMHLRNVFSKTGTKRQAELVSFLWNNHGLIENGLARYDHDF